MNLYRSFGNLMEAWVTEEDQCLDSAWLGNNDEDPPTPSSDAGTNLRSESVDSGVETASSVTSFPATPSSVSADNAEIDTFAPEREVDRLTPASTSQSPVLSSPETSSFQRLSPSRAQERSTALHLKVEQALQKTGSQRLKNKREPLTVDEVLRRRPQASELVRSQRSESFGPRRTINPSAHTRQTSHMCRRPRSMIDKLPAQTRLEDLVVEERKGLSPGLYYLEQVCQMLEEIARQQMHSRALQMEMDALREHQDVAVSQVLNTCQSDSKAAEEDLSFCPSLENTESVKVCRQSASERSKDNSHTHFRRRSASDTDLSTLHLRRVNADYTRGQHLCADDLLEEAEEEYEKQECEKEETNNTNRNWKLKFGSFTRAARDTKGQQMQSSEKNSARRRLSQLFRRRRKTLPV